RIEIARGDLQAALGTIPCALDTLLSLAGEVKKGSAPAAELILLPDGGELQPENVKSVLAAFARMKRARGRIDASREKCEDRRSTPASRAGYTRTIREANAAIEREMRELPLRPALVEQIVKELRDIDRGFDELEGLPPAQRAHARQALDKRAGMPRRRFCTA